MPIVLSATHEIVGYQLFQTISTSYYWHPLDPHSTVPGTLQHKMRAHTLALALYEALIPSITVQTPAVLSNISTPNLNVTTIAARNGCSVIQCWSIPSFTQSATAGTAGALNLFLGEATNATFTLLPPRFDGGLHNAPAPQYALQPTVRGLR